jgi:hypothetical protein
MGANMDHYGISAIHWNANLGEIDEVLLHKLVRHEREGAFVLKRGEPAWCSDVVRLIRGGDMVWIMQVVGRDSYKNTDHVGINVRRGQQAYLYSCTKNGTPTTALSDLPRYQKPDDPPLKPLGVAGSVGRARPS